MTKGRACRCAGTIVLALAVALVGAAAAGAQQKRP